MRQQRISPQQFDIMQRKLIQMEAEGHSPAACVVGACNEVGIKPPRPFDPVEIIVQEEAA